MSQSDSSQPNKAQGSLIAPESVKSSVPSELPLDPLVSATLDRLLEIRSELEARKALFLEQDALLLKLVSLGFVSCARGDEVIFLKDAFASGNTGWTSAAVRRFDLEVISKKLAEKRARKGE